MIIIIKMLLHEICDKKNRLWCIQVYTYYFHFTVNIIIKIFQLQLKINYEFKLFKRVFDFQKLIQI